MSSNASLVFPSFDRVNFEAIHLWEDRERSAVVVEWRSPASPFSGGLPGAVRGPALIRRKRRRQNPAGARFAA